MDQPLVRANPQAQPAVGGLPAGGMIKPAAATALPPQPKIGPSASAKPGMPGAVPGKAPGQKAKRVGPMAAGPKPTLPGGKAPMVVPEAMRKQETE